MVALNPRRGEPATGSPPDPARLLATLDQALRDPEATVPRLRLLRQVLEDGEVTDVPEDDRSWIERFLDPAHVCMYDDTLPEESTTSIHGVEHPAADPAIDLVRQQLDAIGWGQLDGNRILDPEALIEPHGAVNVLYALWCSKGKAIRNRPAFVTWWLREGHEAPDGWLPVELRQEAQESGQEGPEPTQEAHRGANAPEASQHTPEPVDRSGAFSELPQTPERLQQTRMDLLAHVAPLLRPASFQTWFAPLALVAIDGDTLVLQAPDAFHVGWVTRQFGLPLERACRALGFADYRLITPTMNTV